jgi:hypothetical protein
MKQAAGEWSSQEPAPNIKRRLTEYAMLCRLHVPRDTFIRHQKTAFAALAKFTPARSG